eukprot:TRINITY_DN18107_c0_g1_i1.p1 TRINITY_DN18107_c0_g1~~TRINITY_DN18107_c0_g1_i1.p1  ORF type:complete len:306 (+),score=48.42 TRINITY_DN18107_c0_g1_i1:111-1028(+)
MTTRTEKVYALILEEGSWKMRVLRIENAVLAIERSNGDVCHTVRSGGGRVVVERLETSGLEQKHHVAAKLLDQLGKKTDVDIMPCMLSINWLKEDVEKSAVICFSDQMQRDVWLRDIQDLLSPGISLDNEVSLLREELNNAKDDLVQKLATTTQQMSHQQSVSGFPNVIVDPVFEDGYGALSPPTVLYTSPPPMYNSVVPIPTPMAPPSSSPIKKLPLQTPGASPARTPYSASVDVVPPQNLVTGSILQQLQQLEQHAKSNISTLQSLKSQFDTAIADTASWRLERRLQSTDHCTAAMHLVSQFT